MSISSGTKKKPMEAVSFVLCTNPEVLTTTPRPGGAVPLVNIEFEPKATSTPQEDKIKRKSSEQAKRKDSSVDAKKKDSSIETRKKESSLEEKVSREFRVNMALEEIDSIESEEGTIPNPLNDAMYMISIAVSTVMMMAAEHPNIPDGHLKMTQSFLEGVRDDFGCHPPNVQGILNHIRTLQGEVQKDVVEPAPEPTPEEPTSEEPAPEEPTSEEPAPEPAEENPEGGEAANPPPEENAAEDET